MANELTTPPADERIALEDGRPNATWYRIFRALVSSYNATVRTLTSATETLDEKADKTQTVCCSWVFKFPEAEAFVVLLHCPFAWTLTEIRTICEAGTVSVQVLVGGVATSSAIGASTSESATAQSNPVAVGDRIAVSLSSVSSDCENLCITLRGTRELD